MNNKRHEVTKVDDFWGTFRRLIQEFKGNYHWFAIVLLFSALGSVCIIFAPLVIQNLLYVDPITQTPNWLIMNADTSLSIQWDFVITRMAIIISLYVGSALLQWASDFISVCLSGKVVYKLRDNIKKKLDKLPLSYFDRVPYGDTLSIGTNDVNNIDWNLQSILTSLSSGVTLFVGTLIAMFVAEWRLALVALASLPFTIIAVVFVAKFSQKQFAKYRKELGDLNGKVEETYAGYVVVKLFNKQEELENNFQEVNERMATADKWSQFLSGLIWPTTIFINNLAYVGIAVVGGIIKDPGSMIAFFMFLNMFSRPFQQIGQIFNLLQSVVASGDRIYKLMDEKEFTPDPEDAIKDEELIKGNFEFKDVAFAYSPDKPLIDDFTLNIKAGDTVAIVGPTGAGKTTMVNLIMRFYDINSGQILLDGIDTKNYARNTLRGSVGMVLQETWLFRGTIKENLLYGDPNATDEEIKAACKQAHVDHFIDTLPGKYDFVLNEDGTNISQGQRQLLTIARAIISKPRIMILDEATSSVDTRTEQQIQDALDSIMVGRTSFVIAHRLSTIKNAKLIIVMKKGHIVETGTHAELLAKDGFYAELYNAQFAGNNPMAENQDVVES